MSDERVALCPVTPELADQLIALTELDLTDDEAVTARLLGLGWRDWREAVRGPDYEKTPDVPEANFISPQGHFVTCDGDGSLYLPFSYLYWLGDDLLEEDCWARTPGWASEEGAWRPEFDAHFGTVVQRFTDRLGLPDYDIRQPKYHSRYVSWRLEHNVLIVGQGDEPLSYHQFEDAHVYLVSRTAEDVPFPDGPRMRALIAS
jgi:hypothetical protein